MKFSNLTSKIGFVDDPFSKGFDLYLESVHVEYDLSWGYNTSPITNGTIPSSTHNSRPKPCPSQRSNCLCFRSPPNYFVEGECYVGIFQHEPTRVYLLSKRMLQIGRLWKINTILDLKGRGNHLYISMLSRTMEIWNQY